MVRNVLAEESLLTYVQNLGETELCTIGLILGQPSPAKDFVIHLARTPQPAKKNVSEENLIINTDDDKEIAANNDRERKKKMANFTEIPESWVGDHAKHATRMLPGGMYVLGIFVTSAEDLFTTQITKLRNILSQVNKNLTLNPYLHGTIQTTSEKLVLIYNPKRGNYTCKSIDFKTGAQKPVEFKFMVKPTKWHQLDCNFQFDQIIPITNDKVQWNLKKHLQVILSNVESSLKRGVVMIDGELRNENESIESLGKKKQIKNKNRDQESKNLQVNIFVPCDTSTDNDDPTIMSCNGDMHFTGQLASRVFLNQKATIGEATKAIKEDIVRSLAARLEMHSDSLIEEEYMSPEEKSSVHEPPRRVLVPLPSSKITLSDYLFPGEGPSEALISLEELLDLKVTEDDVIKDLEVQAEPGDYYRNEEPLTKQKSEDRLPLSQDSNKTLYLIGITVAILILGVSLLIPYFQIY